VQLLLTQLELLLQGCPLSSKQRPAPLHELTPVHAVVAKGSSCPKGTFTQLPAEPVTLHAWQVARHPELQQTPSMQNPLAHWFVPVQALPFVFFATQTLVEQ